MPKRLVSYTGKALLALARARKADVLRVIGPRDDAGVPTWAIVAIRGPLTGKFLQAIQEANVEAFSATTAEATAVAEEPGAAVDADPGDVDVGDSD